VPEHHHDDMWEVFFVRSGRGTIRLDGSRFELEADDCLAIAPGESHELANDGDEDLVLLYFGVQGGRGLGSAKGPER
jgi:mannose-6-phosphate isomerase-like protein (cupin superfamily)